MNKNFISIIPFLLFISFIIYKSLDQENRLQNNFLVSTGEVIDVETFYSSGHTIFIKFTARVGNSDITSKTSINCDKSNKPVFTKYLIGKKLDIVYDKSDPENCKMLLERKSYIKYKLNPSKESAIILDSINSICLNNN